MSLSRRTLLKGAVIAAGSSVLRATSTQPTITKFTILDVPGEYVRPVAMNAYDKTVVGKSGRARLVRLFVSDGTVGIGVEGYIRITNESIAQLRTLIGVSPESIFQWKDEHIAGYAPQFSQLLQDEHNWWFESPLLDAVGKLRGKPVYALFGAAKRDAVDAYDSSLYFVDIASGKGPEAVGSEAKTIRSEGYRGIKLKVGRPFKWLTGDAGVTRDIEAVIAAREAIGANVTLMADANNGYQNNFDGAVRFFRETSPFNLCWIEEIFPETVEDYRKLHRALEDLNADTPVADGESVRNMDLFVPFLEAGSYRYIQPDMRTSGLTRILYAADLAAPYRVNLVPHNWMSELGKIMSMHASKLRRNIPLVEDDRYHDLALDTSGYQFKNGQWLLPEKPGWGFEVSARYEEFVRSGKEIVVN